MLLRLRPGVRRSWGAAAARPPLAAAAVRHAAAARDAGPAGGDRPIARLKENLPRQLQLDMGHPWVYDDEIENITQLTGNPAGTVVDVVKASGEALGAGLLNRQASIVVRRFDGLASGAEVGQELLRGRIRAAFAARDRAGGSEYGRALHGEQDGLPGTYVDRFGRAAVITFESQGSLRLEALVQEEVSRWIAKLQLLVVHRMASKKEKWAQDGSEFTTHVVLGDTSVISVSELPCTFEFDVHQGVLGQWSYGLESLRRQVAELVADGGTVLDAWSHVGQWGIRCAKKGATEVVMLEESLGFAQLCRSNVGRNDVGDQCTVLHRGSVLDELKSMATSGIRFNCVALNLRPRFEHYYKQRRGQFGRWFKPSLKGYAKAVTLGASVTSRGGYLVASFLLPLSAEHYAHSLVRDGLDLAMRSGSLVFYGVGLGEQHALASSTMEDAWTHVVICVRLH